MLNKQEKNAQAIAQAVSTGSRVVKANDILLIDHIICNTCDGAGLYRGKLCSSCGGNGVTIIHETTPNRRNKFYA